MLWRESLVWEFSIFDAKVCLLCRPPDDISYRTWEKKNLSLIHPANVEDRIPGPLLEPWCDNEMRALPTRGVFV